MRVKVKFDKLYRRDRTGEHCSIAVPVKQGQLWNTEHVQILDGERVLPSQTKITSRYEDGSVRFLFTRFMADLPGNGKKELDYETESSLSGNYKGISLETTPHGFRAECGSLEFTVRNGTCHLFEGLTCAGRKYTADQFAGPLLKTDAGDFMPRFRKWQIVEQGPVCVILEAEGVCQKAEMPGEECSRKEQSVGAEEEDTTEQKLHFVCRITAFAEKPWLDIACRLVNTTDKKQHIASWVFEVRRKPDAVLPAVCPVVEGGGTRRTTGIKELPELEKSIDLRGVRTCVGRSNYKTDFIIGERGEPVSVVADAELLLRESNEHFAEVFYGTFFGDVTDEEGGVCATVYQAQQNFPKAVTAEKNGVRIMLVPEGADKVEMHSGMAREQRFLLHFHSADVTLADLDNRSLIYQMPDTPHLIPEVFQQSGVFPDVFVEREKMNQDAEIALIDRADSHARCYGMMNWGDAPDPGYTEQGRGGGKLVWTNNEYDYPHAMYLMFARTGTRRFLDYANVAASHWMDVDVCHYSRNPLWQGGQWEHTAEHCENGVMVCSHQWVEGLLDCYHLTGNERALQTALGIGENVLKLLETPMYQVSGESNARETGWALRTLTALYVETRDEKWTGKCEWIIGHFKEWMEEYGEWVAPYTDNTTIRVGFMISVAVGSLMRYYRVFPHEELKKMILSAVDDLVDNCLMENGLFYYKELPSLARNGSNILLLEAMTIGWELTGEKRYLEYGRKTFERTVFAPTASVGGAKKVIGDTVIWGGGGTKNFAQSFIPLATYYKALTEADMLN